MGYSLFIKGTYYTKFKGRLALNVTINLKSVSDQ